MRDPRPLWLVAALGVSLLTVAVGAHALQGLGGPLASGEAHFVEVVQADDSGVLAGLVTQTETGPLGLGEDRRAATSGWVVAHPENVEPGEELRVVDEIPFEDPNGGVWMEREVRIGDTTAWAVPLDQTRHDPTIDADYNFAIVVDWDKVPEDQDLTTTYVDELAFLD